MAEWIAERFEPAGFIVRHEDIVRCRDCSFCRKFPAGMVCTLHGRAGYFSTEPQGFCWRGKAALDDAAKEGENDD